MIYLRRNSSITSTISRTSWADLSPFENARVNLTLAPIYGKELASPLITPEIETIDGYAEVPTKYNIYSYSPNIQLFIDHPQTVIWYDNETGDSVSEYINAYDYSDDDTYTNLVVVSIKGDRLVYQTGGKTKELLIHKFKPVDKDVVIICFTDLYGLMQYGVLNCGSYSFSTNNDTSFRLIRDSITYYCTQEPSNSLQVGDELIPNELRQYYEGLCSQNIVLIRSTDGTYQMASLSNTSLSTETYTKTLTFDGTLSVNITETENLTSRI